MAEKKTAKAGSTGLTAEERAAVRARAKELKAAAAGAAAEGELLARIAEMPPPDRTMAERIHALVTESFPELAPKTWYGMPAYARDGSTIFFFRGASKFKTRYATLGFSDKAKLDDDAMWPTDFAITELTPAVEKRITALVKQALS